jgi:LysR family transcriptional regulator, glycine cleavage system transcriptional activator
MLRRLPPLNALKAFEAAARRESFTRAAEELFVTQGAVSHQVKALESELGVKLFNRERQRLIITKVGREYLTILRDAFDRIAVGTESLLQRQSSGVITVSTSPDFAAKWLVSRLGRFAEKHPNIDLRVSATLHHVDFAREDVDLAVPHGDGNWPGFDVVRLSSEQLFPVCSPKLLVGRRRLTRPVDELKFPLIHVDDRKDWARWLEAAGVDGAELSHGPVLNRVSMAIDAALDGQGITLARTTLSATDLINGRLLRPFADELRLAKTYWIICPKATTTLPKIVTFRDWLLAEAANDLRQLKKLGTRRRS